MTFVPFMRWIICVVLLVGLASQAWPVLAMTGGSELQDLIDLAEPGDIIALQPGEYRGPAVIDKPLTLIAESGGQADVVNEGDESAIRITADNVTIVGLRIVDESSKEMPTILVEGDYARLENLRIATGSHGIAARAANDGIVSGAEILWGPEGTKMSSKGNGIDLYQSNGWQLSDNAIADMHDGIYMENSDRALVTGNLIERSRYGIHCMYTAGTVIRGNTGSKNVTGAMVMAARGVELSDNVFIKQSENVHSQGILLFDAHDSVVRDNAVEGNRIGVYIEQSTGNRLSGNVIRYNFIGIQWIESTRNEAAGNSFQGNVTDAQALDSQDNEIKGNYWDSFRGIDENGDGISDIVYAINPLFQQLVQKRAAFQLFFHSPGMLFLEELYQGDRSEWSIDREPLMKPPQRAEFSLAGEGGYNKSGLLAMALLVGSVAIIIKTRSGKQ